jgi:hypothetical protein
MKQSQLALQAYILPDYDLMTLEGRKAARIAMQRKIAADKLAFSTEYGRGNIDAAKVLSPITTDPVREYNKANRLTHR